MGLFALPHLALSEAHFNTYQIRLNRTLSEFFDAQKQYRNRAYVDDYQEKELFNPPECELVTYLQQHPVPLDTKRFESVAVMEHELRYPLGRTKKSVPNLEMSFVMFSPNCGFILGTS